MSYQRSKMRARSGVCLAGLAVVLFAQGAWAGNWRLQPHLQVLETYTDNVDLAPVDKQDDFITRISPGAHLTGEGARINMDVNYTANYLRFVNSSDKSDLRHDLAARLSSELVSEWMFLDANASINQQFIDRGGSLSSNYDNRSDNRKTVQNYLIMPNVRHTLGTLGTLSARYRLSYIRTNADPNTPIVGGVISNSDSHEMGVGFNSGRQFPRLKWGVDISRQVRNREGASDHKRTTLRANSEYPLSPWFSVVGSIGYEKVDDATLIRRPRGLIWDAGFRLHPGPRTTLSARAGRRYGDTNISVDGQYLFSTRTRLSFGYHDTITTSQDVLASELGNQDQVGQDQVGNVIDPGGFSLINNSFRRKRAQLSLNGNRGRNSFNLAGHYETRNIELIQETEKSWGGNARFERAVGPHVHAFVSGEYRRASFESSSGRKDDIYMGRAGWTYDISKSVSGGVEYIYSRRDSNEVLRSLKENAVRVNLQATF